MKSKDYISTNIKNIFYLNIELLITIRNQLKGKFNNKERKIKNKYNYAFKFRKLCVFHNHFECIIL